MSNTVLNPATEDILQRISKKMPHALLLTGKEGVGLSGALSLIANNLQYEILRILPEYNESVDFEKGVITVKSIRNLYDLVKTKGVNRLVVIDYAEKMATPAQNAFLKLLEEPNDSTKFVLLSHTPQLLLPTVLSRVQKVEISNITTNQSNELLNTLGVTDESKRRQFLFMADGLPAELYRLQDEKYFDKRSSIVRDAKQFITGSAYDKSKVAHKYKDSRKDALILLDDVLKLLSLTLKSNHDLTLVKKIDSVLLAYKNITANGLVRLQLAVAMQ